MSETVHYKGTIKLVERIGNETLEDICKRLCIKNGTTELPSYYDEWREVLYDDFYYKYVELNNNIYEITESEEIGDFDIFDMHDNKDGTLDFDVMFYNGGCCLSEALERAYNRMT